jgi:hypothetical protein
MLEGNNKIDSGGQIKKSYMDETDLKLCPMTSVVTVGVERSSSVTRGLASRIVIHDDRELIKDLSKHYNPLLL